VTISVNPFAFEVPDRFRAVLNQLDWINDADPPKGKSQQDNIVGIIVNQQNRRVGS
jgi:hypothetical protein